MTLKDNSMEILVGDAMEQLATLPAESVQCVVTSPPYWGLRDYGTATWEGGDEGCDHRVVATGDMKRRDVGRAATGTFNGSAVVSELQAPQYRDLCGKCGARRIDNQLGLEKTPEEYVEKMVAVFREVKRVLRDDGTVWLNLGDSYAGGAGGRGDSGRQFHTDGIGGGPASTKHHGQRLHRELGAGLKPKDLVGIPWRVAFALQADGWYLRSDIIWSKPNPMPSSATDRATVAHEYIFMLSKKGRYYFDADAVKEPVAESQIGGSYHGSSFNRGKTAVNGNGRNQPDANRRDSVGLSQFRNIRSVWTIATQPYPEAHFATFPEELAKRCILAGSKAGDMVLDPFAGSGTTLKVAIELGRRAVGIELNPDYLPMINRRCATTIGLAF